MLKRIVMVLVLCTVVIGGLMSIAPRARAGSMNAPVLLIHGYNPNSVQDCNTGSMWGTVEQYFSNHSYWNTRSLGFYNADWDCGDYVNQEAYHCTGWYDSGGNDGTVNEDIRHTTCLIAWYIWDYYTQYGTTVAVVAHSMGGILIRQAMNDTPYIGAFPPYLKVSDVATAGTPHQGLGIDAAWDAEHGGIIGQSSCPGNCIEVYMMQVDNPMMQNLNSTSFRNGFGRNPQGSGGTDWTNLASNNDELLNNLCTSNNDRRGAPSNVSTGAACGWMPGATHFVDYPGSYPNYSHGGYLTDTNTSWNATEVYSDNNGGTWASVNNSEHSIFTMYDAILYSSW